MSHHRYASSPIPATSPATPRPPIPGTADGHACCRSCADRIARDALAAGSRGVDAVYLDDPRGPWPPGAFDRVASLGHAVMVAGVFGGYVAAGLGAGWLVRAMVAGW